MHTPLQTLRARIVELIPEIVELKTGCVLELKMGDLLAEKVMGRFGRKYFYVAEASKLYSIRRNGWLDFGDMYIHHSDIWTILGRPIQLADVFRCIKTMRVRMTPDPSGEKIWFEEYEESNVFTHEQSWKANGYYWNLTKPLDDQSEETISFILRLLTNT